jgi:hypothetical protein
MKHLVWLTLILVAVFSSAAVSTKAQSSYGVRANVPFDFIVGDKTLPAGKITAMGVSAADGGPLSITNLDKGQQAFRIGRRMPGVDDRSDRAKLVFHRYGDRYYLAEVWIPGTNAWQVIKSKSEKTLEREARVAKDSTAQVVTIFADE